MSEGVKMEQIYVVTKGAKTPDGYIRVDVTSRSKIWGDYTSPFKLGPVYNPEGLVSNIIENLWQYSKVYESMVDNDKNPTNEYFAWRAKGFAETISHRHPIKGKPLYVWWGGTKLPYIYRIAQTSLHTSIRIQYPEQT